MSRVLIVDDEKSIRFTLREFLVAAGHEVHVAADAHEALRLLDGARFDVVVCDIVLPQITGIELLKAIRHAAPVAQVIMITGEPTLDTATEALRLGAFDYLTKPVNKQAILRCVGNAARVKALEDDRRRLEAENQRHLENLEHLVEERTHHLSEANQQLSEALDDVRRMQEQLIRQERLSALGQLVGGVAHDFNNLLTVILGHIQIMLADVGDGDPLKENLRAVEIAGERATALVRQLLAVGRRQCLQPVPLDLKEIVAGIEPMLRRLLGPAIELCPASAPDLKAVLVDPVQIEQVITNLAVNARDAMPAGGRLTIQTANVKFARESTPRQLDLSPGAYVQLTVTDTGCGMDAQTQSQVFEPFFTTKRPGLGTGLGLATVYGIVKQSGGEIEVESEPGAGASFRIYLPCSDLAPRTGTDRPQPRVIRGCRQQVLAVDDEPAIRELLGTLLIAWDYRVTLAADGEEALRAVEQQGLEPELVITDVVMPGMGGVALVERLRKVRPNVKVLLMSGHTEQALAHHDVRTAETPFLQKPFHRDELAAKISLLLPEGDACDKPARRVLMIDDDLWICELVGRFCRRRGHELLGVSSAVAALEALARKSYDLLLVDMNLPGSDGAHVLREIRSAGHSMPAVMFSGDAGCVDMDSLRLLGAVDVLEKSADPEPLLKLIESLDPARLEPLLVDSSSGPEE